MNKNIKQLAVQIKKLNNKELQILIESIDTVSLLQSQRDEELYRKLYKVYDESDKKPTSEYDIACVAMALRRYTSLDINELKSCQEIYNKFKN